MQIALTIIIESCNLIISRNKKEHFISVLFQSSEHRKALCVMSINFINPNYNLLNTTRTVGMEQGSSVSGSTGNDSSSSTSFSDVLEAVISNENAPKTSNNSNSSTSPVGTVNLDEIFQRASDTYHVPVELLKAVAKAESNFNPSAESHAGAQGIMQLMPGTAKSLGVTNSFDPEQNIMGGAKYLSQQLDRYDGNTVLALAAYNAGPGNVAKYNGVPPFKETQNYITKVMGYAGESITAGERVLAGYSSPARQTAFSGQSIPAGQSVLSGQSMAWNSGTVLQEMGYGLLNTDIEQLDIKDYELLMNLYRYKMQLSILSDSDSDSDSNVMLNNFI